MNATQFVWGIIFLLLLGGCKPEGMIPPTTLTIDAINFLTNTPVSLTNTATFTPTPLTDTATFTPAPTATSMPTPTTTGEPLPTTTFATRSTTLRPTRTPIPTVTPANSIATDKNRFGISFEMEDVYYDYPRIFESADEIGINWVRFRFDSSRQIEREMNQFEWEYDDTVVAKAKEENLQILGVLGYTSLWNATFTPIGGEGVNPFVGQYYPPANYELWGNSIYEIVSHYKDDVHYWEVWNEPDTGGSVSPDSGLWRGSPEEYAQLLATAYNAIKRADPNAKVLLGSLSNTNNSNRNPMFLRDILTDEAYPAADYFDIIGIHFYDYPEKLPMRINDIKKIFASTDTSDRPIWITEIGYPRRGSREEYFCNIITTDMVATVDPLVEKFFLFDEYQLFITPGKCSIYE